MADPPSGTTTTNPQDTSRTEKSKISGEPKNETKDSLSSVAATASTYTSSATVDTPTSTIATPTTTLASKQINQRGRPPNAKEPNVEVNEEEASSEDDDDDTLPGAQRVPGPNAAAALHDTDSCSNSSFVGENAPTTIATDENISQLPEAQTITTVANAWDVDEYDTLKERADALEQERNEMLRKMTDLQRKHQQDGNKTTVPQAEIVTDMGVSKWWRLSAVFSFTLAMVATVLNVILRSSSDSALALEDAGNNIGVGDSPTSTPTINGTDASTGEPSESSSETAAPGGEESPRPVEPSPSPPLPAPPPDLSPAPTDESESADGGGDSGPVSTVPPVCAPTFSPVCSPTTATTATPTFFKERKAGDRAGSSAGIAVTVFLWVLFLAFIGLWWNRRRHHDRRLQAPQNTTDKGSPGV